MVSDFRPHGCDPMGSAVGITPIDSFIHKGPLTVGEPSPSPHTHPVHPQANRYEKQ
jgi:hypothetical protein